MDGARMHERRTDGILIRSTFHFHCCCCCDGGRKVGTLHPPPLSGARQRHIYTFFGRSVVRSAALSPASRRKSPRLVRPAHSFSAGSVARKNSSDDGCDAESNSACMRRRSLLPLPLPLPMSLHQARLAPDGRTRRSAYVLPQSVPSQWDFWLARVALLQFLASNPPPSPADRRTDRQPASVRPPPAPVWHLAVTLGATTAATGLFSVLRHPPCANVQMTRDESVRDPRPKNGSAANAPVPGCPLARWLASPSPHTALSVCWLWLRMTQVLSAMPTRFHSHSKFSDAFAWRGSTGGQRPRPSFLPCLHSASAPIRV